MIKLDKTTTYAWKEEKIKQLVRVILNELDNYYDDDRGDYPNWGRAYTAAKEIMRLVS